MLKHCLIVFLVSMVPVIELRGAIPYGVGFGLPLWLTYCVAIAGNMLPVPVIYFARRVLCGAAASRSSGSSSRSFWKREKGPDRSCRKRRARAVLGAAAVRGHPTAGHRRVDRYAGGQPSGYGLQEERAGLRGRRTAGGDHHGGAEPAGRGGVPRRGMRKTEKERVHCGCTRSFCAIVKPDSGAACPGRCPASPDRSR